MLKKVQVIRKLELRICFACLREAASAKAAISIFGFRIYATTKFFWMVHYSTGSVST